MFVCLTLFIFAIFLSRFVLSSFFLIIFGCDETMYERFASGQYFGKTLFVSVGISCDLSETFHKINYFLGENE